MKHDDQRNNANIDKQKRLQTANQSKKNSKHSNEPT